MSSGIYTFYPGFSQYVTLYRGVTAVWIGSGDNQNPSNPDFPSFNQVGVLYASYIDNSVQNLGPVSSYAEAIASGKAGPGTDFPTEADWILHIATVSQHAQDALDSSRNSLQSAGDSESWAVGTRSGEPDEERVDADVNNSKYWAERAADSEENAYESESAALESEVNAAESATEAKQWANWNSSGDPSSTNNAKSYSEVSGEQRRQSESWAVGTRDGLDDEVRQNALTNNSKYWAEQSQSWATTKENDNSKYYSQVAGQHAQNALASEETAKKWANWNVTGEPSETNNAKSYSDISRQKSLSAEAWANGTRNEVPISSDDEAYNKNSKYWAIQANTSAETATTQANNAETSAILASQWANGSGSGSPSETNNAEYFASLAASRADSVSNPTVDVKYCSSDRASTVPSGEWVSQRVPVKGEYLWTQITLIWGDGSSSQIYTVSYEGLDGAGSVISVNGQTGNIILDGYNIHVDEESETKVSIAQALVSKVNNNDYITDNQIDDLFDEE